MRAFATSMFGALAVLAIASVFAYLVSSGSQSAVSSSQFALTQVYLRAEDADAFMNATIEDALVDAAYAGGGACSKVGDYLTNSANLLSDGSLSVLAEAPCVTAPEKTDLRGYAAYIGAQLSGQVTVSAKSALPVAKKTPMSVTRYVYYTNSPDCGFKAEVRDQLDRVLWTVNTPKLSPDCPA